MIEYYEEEFEDAFAELDDDSVSSFDAAIIRGEKEAYDEYSW